MPVDVGEYVGPFGAVEVGLHLVAVVRLHCVVDGGVLVLRNLRPVDVWGAATAVAATSHKEKAAENRRNQFHPAHTRRNCAHE